VPTVVFNSALGGETIFWVPGNTAGQPANQPVTSPITNNPTVLNNPTVYFIFWGTSWTNANAGALANDAQTIIQSKFFSLLTDYGSDGLVTYGGYTIDNSAAPLANISPATQEVQNIVPATAWATPQDNSPVDSPIYVVVFDTGSDPAIKFTGWNGHPNYSSNQVMNLIWIADSGNNQDTFTDILSHEVAERISDGTSTGIQMSAPVNAGTDNEWQNVQICDNEPDGPYYYRLNGSLRVQPYWSLTYKAFVVPDGNTQTLYLNPTWNTNPSPPQFLNNSNLTIDFDGTLTLQENGSGLSLTLNGEKFAFDPGTINSITVNEGNGNDTANLEGTVPGDPVTINEGGGTDVVNITPSAQFLDNIQGTITVNGGGGTDTLNVDDQNNARPDTWTITGSTITRTFSAVISYNFVDHVNITGGTGDLTYNIQSTESGFATSLDTGPGADIVNVQSTGFSSTLSIDNTFPTANRNVVDIGSKVPSLGGTLANIYGAVNVSNSSGGGTTLNLDDSGDPAGRFVTVTNSSVTGDWSSATFNYTGGQVYDLNLFGGAHGNTFNVQSTASGTTTAINVNDTSTLSNKNFVNVGSLAPSLGGTLANIAGPLRVSNSSGSLALSVDDSGDASANTTTTITNASVTGTWAAGAINYFSNEVSSLTFLSGTGGDTIDVLSTATTTNLIGASASTTVNVGNGGSVQGITGTLNIEAPAVGNYTTIIVDDSTDPTAHTALNPVILSTLGTNPSDSEGNADWWGQIINLAPAHINYEYGDTTSLTINGGTGGNVFNVLTTGSFFGPGNNATTLNTGSGNDAVNVLSTNGALNINGVNGTDTVTLGSNARSLNGTLVNFFGPVNVSNTSGHTTLIVDDSGDSKGHGVIITNNSISGLSPAAIGYTGGQVSSLTIDGPTAATAGSVYRIESTAAGTATSVNGGAGNDGFIITPSSQNFGAIAGALTVNGGGGTNLLTIHDLKDPAADTYTIAVGSVQRTGSAGLTYSGIQSLIIGGGLVGNTFNINSTASGTPVFIGGGGGNDLFNIAPSSHLLSNILGAVTVSGGVPGSNTVNLDDQNQSGAQTYAITAGAMTRTAGAPFAGLNYSLIQTLVLNGGSGADIYNIQSISAATTANGGAGSDTFNVGDASNTLNGLQGVLTINGNGGANTLNVNDQGTPGGSYTLSSTVLSRVAPSAVSITYGTVKTVSLNTSTTGNATLTVLSPVPTATTNFNALGGNNTLVGANVSNTWNITGTNKGTLGKVNFFDVQNLTGGTNNDDFKFVGAGANITGNLNGGGGTADKLDYSGNGGGAIAVNLQTGTATSISGTFASIESLVGSTASTNSLTGANGTNLWNITGLDMGKVNSFSFSKIENLFGAGAGLDTFKFASTAGKVSNITGGTAPPGQADWLDYSAFTALNPVNVNLLLGTATNVSGSISHIENVIGGAGADVLTGDNNGNILIEHGGAGTITGGTGRSLFITGTGATTVNGGSGGDLFVGGKTSYDTTSTGHLDLMIILAEWQSADPYTTRTDEITDGAIPGHPGVKLATGLGGTVTLNSSAVAEHLNGKASATDLDWFFASASNQHSALETVGIVTELVNNDLN
jgi:hypothetical protein